MISIIFAVLVSVSFVFSVFAGTLPELSLAVLDGAQGAVELIFSMLGMMCLWSGVIKVADKAGVTGLIARISRPVLRFIYPGTKDDERALGAIAANFAANLLGLGNAALPLGLSAMESLCQEGKPKSDAMTFAVLATVPIQLFPSTLIALRKASGSTSPYSIILPIYAVSLITYITAAVICRILSVFYGKGDKK